MHKSERLFELVNILRSCHRAISAAQLAARLQVSERTIYRDIQSLALSGVAIEGEAGVGYALRKDASMPPLQFTRDELEALLLGARMVQGWSDAAMAAKAEAAITKILAVLPAQLKATNDTLALQVPRLASNAGFTRYSEECRQAIKQQHCVRINYRDVAGVATERTLEPLGLIFWGATWTLVAHCQLRDDYRCFRLDRIQQVTPLAESFCTTPTKNLQHCLAQLEAQAFHDSAPL